MVVLNMFLFTFNYVLETYGRYEHAVYVGATIPFPNNNYKVVSYVYLDTFHFQINSPSVSIECLFHFFSSMVHNYVASYYCTTSIGRNEEKYVA